jgi:hypothetical protein
MWIANGAEKNMCKLEGKVKYIVDPKHNTMKTWRSGGKVPPILNLFTPVGNAV